ncbi:hypothetical protein QJQ45_024249 [Haematococcus lacustris]|nr:hypothetical protein QJQ45_024249 [Haematococcus lacustris]
MQHIWGAKWPLLELYWWTVLPAVAAKGREYPGLCYKRLQHCPARAKRQQQLKAQQRAPGRRWSSFSMASWQMSLNTRTDVRGSTDSVEELVQRNIQEVLQAAQQAEAGVGELAAVYRTCARQHDSRVNYTALAALLTISHPLLQPPRSVHMCADDCAPRAMQQSQGGRQAAPLSSRPSSGLSSSRLSVGGGSGTHPGAPAQAPAACAPAAAAATAAGGPCTSTSMLDVPGHAEATLRLHKARIKGLEEDVARLTKALAGEKQQGQGQGQGQGQDRDKALAEASKDAKSLRLEQAGWSKEKKALETQVERLQKRASEAEGALTSRDQAVKEGAKESSRAERERRAAEQDARARDVRLQRALDEVEKYKAMLLEVRNQERDGKDAVRADLNRLAADNKKLERQRAELLLAFRKQLKLIDVLKRQKVHLEAARALQFTEAEFLQTLELGST